MAEITKLWIADKMKDLMKQKPINKIRVTEICKAAEIERPTFYYHFKDKYDLVAWIFFQSANQTDVVSLKSAAESMKRMKQDFIFCKRHSSGIGRRIVPPSLWLPPQHHASSSSAP